MILSLETSTPVCSVALHDSGKLIATQSYHLDKSHSGLLPVIIDELLRNCNVGKQKLQAIAIAGGPGSYTGLRIGASTAKGIAYSLDIPLISVPTLYSLARPFFDLQDMNSLILPMLDARRMEVYVEIYESSGKTFQETRPMIIDENSFGEYLDKRLIIVGSGAAKCESVIKHSNRVIIPDRYPDAIYMGDLAFQKYENKQFENTIYYEPDYLKQFQTKKPKNQLLQ